MNRKITLLISLLLLGCAFTTVAQSYCPPDVDFELGDYSYWTYYRGQNLTGPVWSLTSCPHINGLHELTSGSGTDKYGGFPVVANGFYSLKLGHDTANNNADACSYNVAVPSGSGTSFSLIFRYAIVMEYPSTHTQYNRPRWEIDAIDSASGTPVPCDNFSYISSATLPGFSTSSVPTPSYGTDAIYKPWTAGTIDLTGWGGHTIIVSFKVGGCTQGGHFGYAYVDMNCGLFKISTVACKATRATLTAPPGDSTYYWTDSATFSAYYGNTQTVVITVPTVATTYAVILVPFYGYGCRDTLYAKLLPSNLVTNQSHDTTICLGSSVRLTPAATDVSLPLTYFWTPSTGLSCITCDTVTATPPVGKTAYQVTTTDAGGCLQTDTINVTVQPIAGAIKGGKAVCLGLTIALSDSVTGGSWTSGNTTIATIGSSSGVVTGKAVGTASITYTFGLACSAVYTTVTVNPLPTSILGNPVVCVGLTTGLSDATAGGTWTSSSTTAAIGSSSGIVTGLTAGTSTITYTLTSTGCIITQVVTVNPLPGTITGTKTVCQGYTTNLTDGGVGTWSSGNSAVAIVGSSGVVTGESPGTATITYTLTTGCLTTAVVTVNLTPQPISGIETMCIGSTTTLSDITGGGYWTSSDTTVAKVGSSTGVVTGIAATTVYISYSLPGTGCAAVATVTVTPLPGPITGVPSMCVGTTTTLYDGGSGTWSTISTTVSVGPTSGIVTGIASGTGTITYALGTGCLTTTVVTVYPNPPAILGVSPLCIGSCITLSDVSGGGTWFSVNGAIASAGVVSGSVCGISGGVDTIVYTLPTGCLVTTTVLVNPAPSPIAGPSSVCIGSSITLTDPGGGTWTTASTAISCTLGGVVTGLVAGSGTVTYTLPTGCIATKAITVYKPPVGITGSTTVCVGATTVLSDGTGGGTWASSTSAVATVVASGGSAGTVSGWTVGTSTITYAVFSTGCIATTTVTVSAAPGALAGVMKICQGATTTLTDAVTGGLWSSSNTAVATVSGGTVTGVVTGAPTPATSTITYSIGGSCKVTAVVTVMPLPSAISGTPVVCVGSTVTLTDPGGGTWSSSNTTEAIVSGSGVVTGELAGNPVISYSLGACPATIVATVNPLPATITGLNPLCIGSSEPLSDATGGGTWSSSSSAVAYVGSTDGIAIGNGAGAATIFYKLTATGCTTVGTLSVNPLPGAIGGPGSVCLGQQVTETDGGVGTWSTLSTTISVVSGTGVVTGLVVGTGTVSYTLTSTGCTITRVLTVNPLPGPITGPTAVCIGANITLSDAGGGTWTSVTTTIATIGVSSGIVTGGSTLGCTKIIYTLPVTGCINTTTVCVSPSPTTILGPNNVCVGSTITMSDAIGGGAWSAAPTAVGTIDAFGNLTGIATGVDTVVYSLGSGCTISTTVTVNPIPKVITGSGTLCILQSLTVSDATLGGTWSIAPVTVATITPGGVVTGTGVGTATIVYTLGCNVTTTVTVSPTPSTITGASSVCQGSSITLSDAICCGTWTSSGPAATVVGGVVTGASGGVAVITYSLGGACYAAHPVTVNPISPIAGSTTLCAGVTTTLSDATAGGTWSSSTSSVATIVSSGPNTGLLTGVSTGTSTICYTTSAGCTVCTTVNISLSPTAIIGSKQVCKGSTTCLSDAVFGGAWSDPTSLATGTIDPVSGCFTGVTPGTALISYSLGGSCQTTATVTVNDVKPITGNPSMCVGDKQTLTDGVPLGKWTTSSPLITLGSGGLVTAGFTTGVATVTYTNPSGCISTFDITINSVPLPIAPPLQVCKGQSITLSDATVGGGWSTLSGNITIGGTTGLVTGVNAGTATVTYALGSSCNATAVVTVNPLPGPILPAVSNVCVGSTIVLSDAGGGTWSTPSTTASINVTTGVLTGLATPSALVTYTLPTGCLTSKVIPINPLPAAITGPSSVCQGQSITLVDYGGGTWSTGSTLVTLSGSGVVTGKVAGVATITYTLSTGCYVTTPVTVLAPPTPIGGKLTSCVGNPVTLTDGTKGGVWESSDVSIATIGSLSGTVNPITSGTVLMSYTIGGGCTQIATFIVNPVSPVTGPSTVCQYQTARLYDTTLGGTWSSLKPSVATVDAASGIVTGVSAGSVTIVYTLSTGCTASYVLSVLPAPKPITGPNQVCQGQTTTLIDATPLGTWSSLNPGIANPLVPTAGTVLGVGAGVTLISFTGTNGCAATYAVTVNAIPAAISGNPNVCVGQTTALSDATAGGVWSSSLPSIGSVDVSGIVTGIKPGVTNVVYTLTSTGCFNSISVNVNSLPGAIIGGTNVCVGQSIILSDTTSGGAWTTSDPTTAVATTIGANTGSITGIKAGPVNVYYTLGTGCAASTVVMVNPIPAGIVGQPEICVGQTVTYTDPSGPGTWNSADTTIAKVGLRSGMVTGIFGPASTIITYTSSAGCQVSSLVTVDPAPDPIVGNTVICVGVNTTLFDLTGGGNWSSSLPAVSIDAFGDIRGMSPGTSTISYTMPATGCASAATVLVYNRPTAISGNVNVCYGATDLFTDSVTGGTWSSTAPLFASVGSTSGLVTGLAYGPATIIYTLAPFATCMASLNVNVVPLPTRYPITGGGVRCADGAGIPVGLGGSATGVNYLLYNGGKVATGPIAGTGAAITFGPQKVGGTYTVLATNTGTGCNNLMTGTVDIIVNPTVIPSVNVFSSGGDTVCSGVLTTFTANAVDAGASSTYVWNVNGTNVGLSSTYSYVPANGDVVMVTVTADTMCASPATVSNYVKMTVTLPQLPVASISADPGDTVCQGKSVTLTANATYGGSSPSMVWMKNGVKAGTGNPFSYLPDNGDLVYVTMTSNYPCVTAKTVNSGPVMMTVDSPLIPSVTIVTNPGPNIGIGWNDTLKAIVANAGPTGATYQWYVNGYPIKGANSYMYSSSKFQNGDSVSVAVTSSGLCSMTNHNWVYINVSAEGVQNITQATGDITVLPNPNKGEFMVKGSLGTTNDEQVTLELTDLLGQVVYTNKVVAKNGNVNEKITLGKTLANGMYLLNLRSGVENKVFHVVVEQ